MKLHFFYNDVTGFYLTRLMGYLPTATPSQVFNLRLLPSSFTWLPPNALTWAWKPSSGTAYTCLPASCSALIALLRFSCDSLPYLTIANVSFFFAHKRENLHLFLLNNRRILKRITGHSCYMIKYLYLEK